MTPSELQTKPRRRLTRRRFFAAAAATGIGVYTWQVEPRWAERVERKLPIANLPAPLVGRKIVLLTDIHVGPVSPTYLAAWFREIATWNPAMILISGDFMSAKRTERIDDTLRQMELLPRTELGTFAVLGNHDYGEGWTNVAVADELSAKLSKLDVRVLRNDCVEAGGLQILGVDDLWSGEFDLIEAFQKFDSARPALALCHNPDGVDRKGWNRYRGWILAGHTHGGQCKPPFLDPPILPVRNKRYTSGEFELEGGRRLYISRGIGHVMKVRFNVRPEVTVFELSVG